MRVGLVNRWLRGIFCWKFHFYELWLPVLGLLGPAWCDAVLCGLGRATVLFRPGRKETLKRALRRAGRALDLDAPIEPLWPDLAANTARILARDYPLDRRCDASVLGRFDVRGRDHLERTLAAGKGAIVVGSHMGAHIAGLHWLFRAGLPVRAVVQRPRHISRELGRRFDAAGGAHRQADLFLHRDLSPQKAVERMVRARAALRDGMAMYLCGDIPWPGSNTRTGRLLGHSRRFLTIWIDLAVLTRAPVFYLFCTHREGGRFALELEAVGRVHRGEEDEALADYLKQLEARIATLTTQAVPYLLWPSYDPAAAGPTSAPRAGRVPTPGIPRDSAGSPAWSRCRASS
jgi:lauroyl/myristoyl acyltransferase